MRLMTTKKRGGAKIVMKKAPPLSGKTEIVMLFELCGDGGGNALHLVGWQAELLLEEVHVALLVGCNHVNVGVGHFEAHNSHTDSHARHCLTQGGSHTFCKFPVFGIFVGIDVENIVNLLFGDYQSVSRRYWVDVEESKEVFALCNLVARNLAGGNFAEDCSHMVLFN